MRIDCPSDRKRYSCVAAVTFMLVVSTAAARADEDDPDAPANRADGIGVLTRQHLLKKVPNFFFFEYPFKPQPGKRLWMRVDDKLFLERYPDGTESRYKILGQAAPRGTVGTVVMKVTGDEEKTQTQNTGSFQVFIPDKDSDDMAILFRSG